MSLYSAVSSVPEINSISDEAQAAAMGAQPSTESWSVNASTAKPSRRPCPANSSGEKVPSEKCVCRCKSANFIYSVLSPRSTVRSLRSPVPVPGPAIQLVGRIARPAADSELWTQDSFDYPRRTHQFAAHLVENAVDEFAAVLRGKFFGDVHRLVDADDGRDVLAEQHLVNCQPHDVAVHRGDAMELPILRMLPDARVNFLAVLD